MDGLLIDSEPLWQQAGMNTLEEFGISITLEQYHQTTGLRTSEWIDWWFTYFNVNKKDAPSAIRSIEDKAISLIQQHGVAYPGTDFILDFFKQRNFNIGLATSSPLRLVDVVVKKLDIAHYFQAYSSAEHLAYGKPHPEVYMNCAKDLGVKPQYCICFEDSFNGLISSKAAKMKCVVIPAADEFNKPKWNAADGKISSLLDFNQELLDDLTGVQAEGKLTVNR